MLAETGGGKQTNSQTNKDQPNKQATYQKRRALLRKPSQDGSEHDAVSPVCHPCRGRWVHAKQAWREVVREDVPQHQDLQLAQAQARLEREVWLFQQQQVHSILDLQQ